MKIVYCSDDFNRRTVDPNFEKENRAACKAGFTIGLVDFSALRRSDNDEAFRYLKPASSIEPAIYRGWMLTPEEYDFLYTSLLQENTELINASNQYLHCHWLPNCYPTINRVTPQSIWISKPDCFDMAAVLKAIRCFHGVPLIVKDYVKSRKHEWYEACFIPDSFDETTVSRVTMRFLELQGDDLQGGLVFREFVDFQPMGHHPKSGMPLTLEYRLFVYQGNVISVTPYWDAQYEAEAPQLEQFQSIFSGIKSNFFSCDIARRTNGEWMIVELGDGQVSGLPEQCNATDFYRQLGSASGMG